MRLTTDTSKNTNLPFSARAKVRDHIETRPRSTTNEIIANLLALDQTLKEWNEALPEFLKYNRRNLYEQLVVKQQPMFSILHAAHHQCRLALHSSLVPGFGDNRLPEGLSPEFVEGFARVALDSAQKISSIARDLHAIEWDAAKLPPFMGYCMYSSASIHTNILGKTSYAAATTRSNIISALKLLGDMEPYWRHMERLVRIYMCLRWCAELHVLTQ